MFDPQTYYPIQRDQLLPRLVLITAELANLHRVLSDAKQKERRARDNIIHGMGPDASVAAAKRDADLGTYEEWNRISDLEGEIASYIEERNLIHFLLDLPEADE